MTWRHLHVLLRVVVSGSLVAYLVWRANPATIWTHWQAVDLRLFVLALLLQFAGIALSAAKWGMLLRAQGKEQPYRWLVATYLAGQFAGNFLPTNIGGDALRATQLGRRMNSFSEASASIFVERLTGFLALSLIASLAILTSPSSETYSDQTGGTPLLLITAGMCVLTCLMLGFSSVAQRIFPHRDGHSFRAAASRILHRVARALSTYVPRGHTLWLVLGMSLLYQALLIAMHVICGMALGITTPLRTYAIMVPVSDILGMIPIFVNGVGARDLVFTHSLGLVGIVAAHALALSFLVFTVRLLISVIGGLVMMFGTSYHRAGQATREAAPDARS